MGTTPAGSGVKHPLQEPATAEMSGGSDASSGLDDAAGGEPRTPGQQWGWQDLWRHGGTAALLVVFGALWLLVALWIVSSGAPSAGGTPPEIDIVNPAQPPEDR